MSLALEQMHSCPEAQGTTRYRKTQHLENMTFPKNFSQDTSMFQVCCAMRLGFSKTVSSEMLNEKRPGCTWRLANNIEVFVALTYTLNWNQD